MCTYTLIMYIINDITNDHAKLIKIGSFNPKLPMNTPNVNAILTTDIINIINIPA